MGRGLKIAQLDAREMLRSRMRMFNPRPNHDGLLMASRQFSDAGLPHMPPARCLVRVSGGDGEKLHLMHEFTTDILEIRFDDNAIGQSLISSSFLKKELAEADIVRREWLFDSVWLTLGTALASAGAQRLDVDPLEVAVVVRRTHDAGVLSNREIILYDTTAGGAGYARQLGDAIRELLEAAVSQLSDCECEDSCYACIRTYNNQLNHNRLHRMRIRDGLAEFVRLNWDLRPGTAS